jgi:hypothetical protein
MLSIPTLRSTTAVFLLSTIGSLACANRGMHAPTDGGPGAGGTAAAGRGGQAGTSARGGTGGTGGAPTGVAGTGGTGGAASTGTSGTGGGAACRVAATDGGATGGACGSMFNFESGTQGAMITGTQLAFKTIAQSGTFTYCGGGALAITSMFTGTMGTSTKGEVLINLPGAPVDLTGKTISVHVASDPGCSADLYLSMVVNTQTGPMYFTPPFQVRPITNQWQTGSVTVSADGGSTAALAVSLQMFSATGYQGTIYVDELDIR